jgi:hypothetical protein
MRTRIVVITLIGILLLTVGCSAPWNSTPSPSRLGLSSVKITPSVKPVGNKITVPVDASHVLNVEIPDVGHLSGPTGAFTGPGSITIQPEKASFASSSPFQTSGAGMDVAFDGTSLRQPLTLAFDASTKPSADAVPLVAHQGDDGQWNFLPATLDSSGRITVQTSSFSLNIPGWGIADAIFHAIGNFLASGIGGRTSPLTCTGAPKWFHLDLRHSDLVHACATTNHTSSGQLVAEVQIKSNRGVSLEVTVPSDPTYVWVDGQPWPERQEVGSFLHFDPNRTVILGAGQTMTVGYTQWATSLPVSFFVTGATPLAFIDTLTGDLFNTLMSYEIGQLPDQFSTYIGIAYTEVQCAASLRINSLSGGIKLASIGDYLKCMGSAAVSELHDRQTALNVVLKFGGSVKNVDMIVKAAKALNFVGWIFTLWPYFQAGWGNIIDKLNELLSNGESALVTWHMDPPVPTNGNGGTQTNPPVTVTTGTGNPNPSNPTVTLAQGPVVSGGAYRYAITLSGFPANATVSVECYDSVSPSGFYNFGLTTDSSGNGFTQSQCYSGDGPDHWVVANGITSNHVQWGGTSSPPPPTTYSETTGGAAHTWTDYTNAGGTQGPTIPAYQTVEISCKVTGFKVADGNTWWYRIASAPWSNAYYVSADAFYNNGATSGPLKGTPFVDPAVPNC